VEVGGKPIAILRAGDGSFRALRNMCAHQGATLSDGRVVDEVQSQAAGQFQIASERSVLRCPWHGYEFAVESGRCLADPDHLRVRTYPVSVEEGQVVVEV
jgi:nitrite reductase/ring-hydroxylating ferredoxin subunit